MTDISIRRFLIYVLLCLPPAFALWYLVAPILLIPVELLAHAVLTWLYPNVIAAVERVGNTLDIVTHFSHTLLAPSQLNNVTVPSGMASQVIFSLDVLSYGYGMALFLALLLATPSPVRHKLIWLALGWGMLALVQVWGVCFEAILTLVFKTEPAIAQRMNTTALSRELIALGYQLGYLILPAVIPLLIWAYASRRFLAMLVPQFATVEIQSKPHRKSPIAHKPSTQKRPRPKRKKRRRRK